MLIEDEVDSDQILPSINDLALNTMDKLKEDTILERKVHAIRRDDIELGLVECKGYEPNKAKWMDRFRVGELYLHLCIYGTNCFLNGEV